MATNKDCVISVDIGTSSVRACLVNSDLSILFQAQESIDLFTDIKGKAEQDPTQVIDASMGTIAQAADYARKNVFGIQAISFSNAVSSLVQLNADFFPIGNFLTYADTRSYKEVEILREQYQTDFFKNSAVPLHASYWLPKILWMKNNGLVDGTVKYFCTIKDLLVQRLTGCFVIDQSNAVATGICDAEKIDWHPAFLEIMGLNPENFPKIYPTTEKLDIKLEMKSRLGLSADTTLVLGATDGVLSSLGAGAVNPGQVTTMIGSSGACRIAANSPLLTEKNLTWSYPLADDIWVRGGAMNSGGLVVEWLIDNFYQDFGTDQSIKFQKVFNKIQDVPAGSEGLIFLPYIFGERAPIWDENARGVYFGIHASHNRDYFAKATIEGIIFALFSIFEIIRINLSEKIEILATGGYTQSLDMVQIQADIFGYPIKLPKNHEGSVIGAAALAFKSIGIFNSISVVNDLIKINHEISSNYENHAKYQIGYEKFKGLYKSLKPMFSNH